MSRFAAACVLFSASVWGETAVQHLLENKMFSRIHDYDASLRGALGVATIDLTSGRVFVYNGEAIFPTASSIKIQILAQMFRAVKQGEFQLSDRVTLQPSEAVGGSGRLQTSLREGPQQITVRDLMTAMIEHSDNTATNRCIAMARMNRVNRMVADLGFRTIRLQRVMMDSAAAQRGDENVASPVEMAHFVELLYRGKLGDAEATRQMIGMLKLVKAGMRDAIPPEVAVASKPGDLPGVECETGIVYLSGRPFILSVFSTFLDEGVHPVREITKIVFDYFSKLDASNEYGNRLK